MAKTLEEVHQFCRENGIRIVDFKMTDISGRWRHLSIPVERLTEKTMKYGIGFDGSNYGYAALEKSDMVFVPDLDSAALDPYSDVPTLSMIGDVMVIDQPENHPFDQYPRNVAKRAKEYMQELGIADEMIVGPEYEFYIFDEVHFDNGPGHASYSVQTRQSSWAEADGWTNNGYQVPHKDGYHTVPPRDVNFDLRNRISMELANWGINVKYHHTEVGACGQQEIETELGEMVSLADATMAAKYVIKNEAFREGKTATFMPKPIPTEAGNGLHVHMLLVKDGKPVFFDPEGYMQLSQTAMWFIGGLLKHSASLCAITNPTTNSYKRLVPGFEAPVTVGFASANRSAVVRIPAYAKSPMDKRFELRNPDATCNPYYAFSAILMAGLDGIANRIDPKKEGWGPYDFNLYSLSPEEQKKIGGLPKSLDEAVAALEADHDYLTKGGVFPESLLKILIDREKKDSAKISALPHPEEFAMYYDL